MHGLLAADVRLPCGCHPPLGSTLHGMEAAQCVELAGLEQGMEWSGVRGLDGMGWDEGMGVAGLGCRGHQRPGVHILLQLTHRSAEYRLGSLCITQSTLAHSSIHFNTRWTGTS